MKRWSVAVGVVLAVVVIVACYPRMVGADVFTLYRNSVLDANMRIHIATFDTYESGPSYNKENCETTRPLFQRQPGVTVKYWCEKGRYTE
jgi:hypothetical protein